MIANKLKEYRKALGMTQEELSEKSSVSRTIIYKLETNQKVDCKLSTLLAIADVIGKPVSEIFLQ